MHHAITAILGFVILLTLGLAIAGNMHGDYLAEQHAAQIAEQQAAYDAEGARRTAKFRADMLAREAN